MLDLLPLLGLFLNRLRIIREVLGPLFAKKLTGEEAVVSKRSSYLAAILTCVLAILIIAVNSSNKNMVSPLTPLQTNKSSHEVFGFAPFWTFDKLGNIDFDTLTTLAYFSVPVNGDGSLDKGDIGYQTFESQKATALFQQAHAHGTRVVLTLTQMNAGPIFALLDDPWAQQNAIAQAVDEVQGRGIDGINVDFEYGGDPGQDCRDKFTKFVADLTDQTHKANPNSRVTVSVYAASVKEPKLYDIAALAKSSDDVFMMAYDFANASSANATPTAPLYGYKEGQYWYDVSSAVDDFLTQMPADKLILGVPWYGYNYPVNTPQVKAVTGSYYVLGQSQTYEVAQNDVRPDMRGILDFKSGWDNIGKVGWKAYLDAATKTWRMLFIDDSKSLGLKYDFAKQKNLAGIGIWALGFDGESSDLWPQLHSKFGEKIADSSLFGREITTYENN